MGVDAKVAFWATWVMPGVINAAALNGVHVASSVKIQNRGRGQHGDAGLDPGGGRYRPAPGALTGAPA